MKRHVKVYLGALVFLVGFILFLLLYLDKSAQYAQCTSDLASEQQHSADLDDQVDYMSEANHRLRDDLIELHANFSRVEVLQEACLRQLPSIEWMKNMTLKNRVPLADVQMQSDAVTINIKDVTPGTIAPTGSMMPILSANDTVLEVTPQRQTDVYVGDIIVYELDDVRVIHRVIRIGVDETGWYAITKGDNNPREDLDKVRFSQVKGVVVGIIY